MLHERRLPRLLLAFAVGTITGFGGALVLQRADGFREPARSASFECIDATHPSSENPERVQDREVTPRIERAPSPDSASADGAVLRASSSLRILGRVMNRDGVPVENAGLWLDRQSFGSSVGGSPDAITDREGNFAFSKAAFETQTMRLLARKAGFEDGERKIEISPGATLDIGTLHLDRAACLRMRLLTTDGFPVPDVEVGLWSSSTGPPESYVKRGLSNEAGEVWFQVPAEGSYRALPTTLRLAGFPVDVTVLRGETTERTVVVEELGVLTGRATLRGAHLVREAISLIGDSCATTSTDEAGRFRFPAVVPGSYVLRRGAATARVRAAQIAAEVLGPTPQDRSFAKEYFAPKRQETGDAARRVDVQPGFNERNVDFEAGTQVVIRVRDVESRPVPNATVHLFDEAALASEMHLERPVRFRIGFHFEGRGVNVFQRTDTLGACVLGDLSANTYTILARAPGHAEVRKTLAIGSDGVHEETLVLPRGEAITGEVHDTRGPVKGAWVVPLRTSRDEPLLPKANVFVAFPDVPMARTDERGTFELQGLSRESHRLLLWSGAHGPAVVDALAPGSTGTVRLELLGSIDVKIETSDGEPRVGSVGLDFDSATLLPAEAWDDNAFFQTFGAWVRRGQRTGTDGRATLTRVIPGPWTLVAEVSDPHEGTRTLRRPIHVAPGSRTRVVVTLDKEER